MAETWIRIAQDVQSDREATGNGGGSKVARYSGK
jgi:hypothetical protein